jgi:bifunctional non-homologous end joining protein LigD
LPDTTHPRTGGLRYGVDVGTGHMQIMVTDLPAGWPRCTRDTNPFTIHLSPPRSRRYWAEPRMVGEVAFTEWISDQVLRHLSWSGLRSDKYPDDYAGQPNSAYTGSQHAGPRAG